MQRAQNSEKLRAIDLKLVKRVLAKHLAFFISITSVANADTVIPNIELPPYLPLGTILYPPGLYSHYSVIDVKQTETEKWVEYKGLVSKPAAKGVPKNKYGLCHNGHAVCVKFSGKMSEGFVAASSRAVLMVRKIGHSEWDKVSNTTEERLTLSIEPYFLTVNCSVTNGHITSWKIENMDKSSDYEFRIKIKKHKCGELINEEDSAD